MYNPIDEIVKCVLQGDYVKADYLRTQMTRYTGGKEDISYVEQAEQDQG